MLKRAIGGTLLALATLLLIGSATPAVAEAATVYVTVTADDGPGSFRAAIEAANNDPGIDTIRFRVRGPITLTEGVEYTGTQTLHVIGGSSSFRYPFFSFWFFVSQPTVIQGAGYVGDVEECPPLFLASGGGDLDFQNITFQNWIATASRWMSPRTTPTPIWRCPSSG